MPRGRKVCRLVLLFGRWWGGVVLDLISLIWRSLGSRLGLLVGRGGEVARVGGGQVAVAPMNPGEPAPPQPLLSLLVRTGA